MVIPMPLTGGIFIGRDSHGGVVHLLSIGPFSCGLLCPKVHLPSRDIFILIERPVMRDNLRAAILIDNLAASEPPLEFRRVGAIA